MQVDKTNLTSPDVSLKIEYDKSFPISWTYDPADLAICPPLPGFNSTLCMIVPTGTAFNGIAFPGLISALFEEITLLPINNFCGAKM